MSSGRYTQEQILKVLAKIDAGASTASVSHWASDHLRGVITIRLVGIGVE